MPFTRFGLGCFWSFLKVNSTLNLKISIWNKYFACHVKSGKGKTHLNIGCLTCLVYSPIWNIDLGWAVERVKTLGSWSSFWCQPTVQHWGSCFTSLSFVPLIWKCKHDPKPCLSSLHGICLNYHGEDGGAGRVWFGPGGQSYASGVRI